LLHDIFWSNRTVLYYGKKVTVLFLGNHTMVVDENAILILACVDVERSET
jgi:hypothetical protein